MPDFTNCRRAQRYSCANDLIMDALEHANVAMLPGSNFGLPESDLVARMAFVDFDGGAAIDVRPRLPSPVCLCLCLCLCLCVDVCARTRARARLCLFRGGECIAPSEPPVPTTTRPLMSCRRMPTPPTPRCRSS